MQMNKNRYFNKKGFTLIEVLVTMSIFVVLIFGVSAILNDIFVNSSQELLSMNNIDQARSVLSAFTNEIRNASVGSDGAYPINLAGDSEIIFFSNFKTINSAVARIRYYILDDVLYKGIVLPTGSPLRYNLSSELVRPVVTGLSHQSTPIFYYYDGDYSGGSDPLFQPVNINRIRYIKISLKVLNQITQNDTSAFLIEAGTTIRSVKDNLGN